jgi:hypothetical protein
VCVCVGGGGKGIARARGRVYARVYVCVPFLIRHATRRCHIVTSIEGSMDYLNLRRYLINGRILEKKLLNIKCVLILSISFV